VHINFFHIHLTYTIPLASITVIQNPSPVEEAVPPDSRVYVCEGEERCIEARRGVEERPEGR
jgi:hypothetical protein